MNCQWTRAPKQKLGGNLTRLLLLLPYVRTLRERKTRSSLSRELFFFCKRSKRKTAYTQNVSRCFPEQNAAAENQKKYWGQKKKKEEKKGKQKNKEKLRRTLTLVVGENSSVKHAFPVSTTATTTTRRIALPHLRPSLCPALSLSLSLSLFSRRTFPAPCFPLPWFCPLDNLPCPMWPFSLFPCQEIYPCSVFPSRLSSTRGRNFPCLVFSL